MRKENLKISEGDSVTHEFLGEGEVMGILYSRNRIPIYGRVLWDRDPSREYNMGTNPCIEPLRLMTKIEYDE